MDNKTFFYIFGIALVVSALAVSAAGLRFEKFPPSRLALAGIIGAFIALVGATTTFAVLQAADEQHARQAEEAQAAETTTGTTSTSAQTTGTTSTTARGPGSTVNISADPSGQLAFQQKSVTAAKPGAVKIDFTNQAPVGHDVHVADASGKDLGGTQVITGGSTSATVDLSPGKYTFFCSVPGHEAAGMKGTLVVK